MTSVVDQGLLTLDGMQKAEEGIRASGVIRDTPMLHNVGYLFDLPASVHLSLKLESMQAYGSFKIRGVTNQFNNLAMEGDKNDLKLITFSAGNYGKAFSVLCNRMNYNGKVLLPDHAPESRIQFIRSMGVDTEKVPGDQLLKAVEEHKSRGYTQVQSVNDLNLVAGYSPMAKEILREVPDLDVLLVCCGGGSLLAGLAAGVALLGSKAIVYGVEPTGADKMKRSLIEGQAVRMPEAHSIATGLCPPIASQVALEHCKKYVKDILLVSDDEIRQACRVAFENGLKTEPSGCAAIAALFKCPEIKSRIQSPNDNKPLRVVAVVSGGNVTATELASLFQ